MAGKGKMFGPPGYFRPPCGMPPVPPSIPTLPAMPPLRGPVKVRDWRFSPDGKYDLVHFRNGMPGIIPHGYVFDGYGFRGNGPRFLDTHDIRGDISNSEGMDAPNLWFNNSDCGQNF